jgi:hypothetical protein
MNFTSSIRILSISLLPILGLPAWSQIRVLDHTKIQAPAKLPAPAAPQAMASPWTATRGPSGPAPSLTHADYAGLRSGIAATLKISEGLMPRSILDATTLSSPGRRITLKFGDEGTQLSDFYWGMSAASASSTQDGVSLPVGEHKVSVMARNLQPGSYLVTFFVDVALSSIWISGTNIPVQVQNGRAMMAFNLVQPGPIRLSASVASALNPRASYLFYSCEILRLK